MLSIILSENRVLQLCSAYTRATTGFYYENINKEIYRLLWKENYKGYYINGYNICREWQVTRLPNQLPRGTTVTKMIQQKKRHRTSKNRFSYLFFEVKKKKTITTITELVKVEGYHTSTGFVTSIKYLQATLPHSLTITHLLETFNVHTIFYILFTIVFFYYT